MSVTVLKTDVTRDIKNNPFFKEQAFINGQWVNGTKRFSVINPATEEEIANVADLGAEETRQAIEAANRAWEGWRNLTAQKRSDYLRKWYDLQIKHKDDLAALMTWEQGKPYKEALGEIEYGANFCEVYAEEAKRIYGDILPSHTEKGRVLVLKQPVGVVGAITPWNFPFAMITRKAAPALAAGCPVVIKPSEETPLCALALAALAEQAGFPKGVINIVTTSNSKEVGQELTSNALVRKISFTGSTAVGKTLYKQSADTVKKISLELGGNGAFIVFDDADLEKAASDLVAFKFKNCGQICTNVNRAFIHASVFEEFTGRVTEKIKALKLGNGFDDQTDCGPLIYSRAIDKIQDLISDAKQKGANIITGGHKSDGKGWFFEPTLLTDVTPQMKIWEEEIFGPVLPLYSFDTEDEALRLANDTDRGLANYAYTKDSGRIWRMAEGLESGIIALNAVNYTNVYAPFGGYKESGLGREGGKYGLEEFLETKYVFIGDLV